MITKSLSHEEFLRRKRNKKFWKIGIVFFILILLIIGASYGSHRKEIRVSKVILNGGILVTEPEVESKTLTFLYGSYFWLFPKGTIFWYPHDSLERYLKETFKRIDLIDIRRDGLTTLVIDIKERKPFALWCTNEVVSDLATSTDETTSDLKNEEKCYFMDQNSTIFAKAPNFSGDAYFKYYGLLELSPDESPIGKEYLASTTQFASIYNFVTKTKELSIKPQFIVAKNTDEFSLTLSGGGEIYFDMKQPLSIVGQNLEALLRTPVFASSTGNLPVEYIDLRYGNKLFYKLKQ